MSALADAVRAMDHHFRYADMPRGFKRWFAVTDWKARRANRANPNRRYPLQPDHFSRRLNAMLARYGRPDLHIKYVGRNAQ